MTETASRFVRTWLEFSTALRMNEGFDEEKYRIVLESLEALAREWAELEQLPKATVSVLVDVFPTTESNAHLYDGALKERIAEAAYELHEHVQLCVATDESM
ncbi:hypothetical protein [Saccharopolyspora gregorii]|uniref:Uncharacterized protein n=1 Tax=Saccharopolyspora gregorii TaxID=33914 RepID=A0ABP6RV51_9PSEU